MFKLISYSICAVFIVSITQSIAAPEQEKFFMLAYVPAFPFLLAWIAWNIRT